MKEKRQRKLRCALCGARIWLGPREPLPPGASPGVVASAPNTRPVCKAGEGCQKHVGIAL